MQPASPRDHALAAAHREGLAARSVSRASSAARMTTKRAAHRLQLARELALERRETRRATRRSTLARKPVTEAQGPTPEVVELVELPRDHGVTIRALGGEAGRHFFARLVRW